MSKEAAEPTKGADEVGEEKAKGLTGDGDTTEAKLLLDGPDISDGVGGRKNHGLGNEAILEPRRRRDVSNGFGDVRGWEGGLLLDGANHGSLHGRREVVVNDSHTSVKLWSQKKARSQHL